MPIIAQNGQDDEENKKLSSAAGTSLGGFSRPNATQQQTSTGQYTDINKYVEANKGQNIKGMAEGIAERTAKDTASENERLRGVAATANANQGTGSRADFRDFDTILNSEGTNAWMNNADTNRGSAAWKAAGSNNPGAAPSFSATNTLGNIRDRALGNISYEGRMGKSFQTTPNYTQGQSALDNFLIQRDPNAINVLKTAAENVKDTSGASDAITAANNRFQMRDTAAQADKAAMADYNRRIDDLVKKYYSDPMAGGSRIDPNQLARINALDRMRGGTGSYTSTPQQMGVAAPVDLLNPASVSPIKGIVQTPPSAVGALERLGITRDSIPLPPSPPPPTLPKRKKK